MDFVDPKPPGEVCYIKVIHKAEKDVFKAQCDVTFLCVIVKFIRILPFDLCGLPATTVVDQYKTVMY